MEYGHSYIVLTSTTILCHKVEKSIILTIGATILHNYILIESG
jgi:hypothetical protein